MKMLIVEDSANHLADAKSLVTRISEAFGLEVRYASTLEEATNLIEWADAVVTDVSIPEKAGKSPKLDGFNIYPLPAGVELAVWALHHDKPAIVLSSSHRTGQETSSEDWARDSMNPMVAAKTSIHGMVMNWEAGILFAIYLVHSGVKPVRIGFGFSSYLSVGRYSFPIRAFAGCLRRRELVKKMRTLNEVLEDYYALPV